jgi:hypothetical protein
MTVNTFARWSLSSKNSEEPGPKGRSDFRLKNADFRFKSSGSCGKERMHHNLQSTICNHRSYIDWPQGLARIIHESVSRDCEDGLATGQPQGVESEAY